MALHRSDRGQPPLPSPTATEGDRFPSIKDLVMSRILLPIPSRDFDPTEIAVSWKLLTQRGHRVVFATPDGKPGACDPIMLSGIGLDPWSTIPGLRNIRILGLVLSANADARSAYAEMLRDPAFANPMRWDRIESKDFGALLLGGGHRARGMRDYLESKILQRITAEFFADEKPVGAICHGVVLAARSKRADGRSVLYGRKTTALPWALERKGSALAHVGRFWDRNYYRTYPEAAGQPAGYMSVQQEVARARHFRGFHRRPRQRSRVQAQNQWHGARHGDG